MADPIDNEGYIQLPDQGADGHHALGSTSSHPNRPHRASSLRTVDSQVIIDNDAPPSNSAHRPSTSHSRNPSDSATAAASPSHPPAPPHPGNPSHPNSDLAKPTGNLKTDSAPPTAPLQAEDPWYKNWSSILSLELKNTGSVARDHLASERTFLAWMRTSISLAMAGVAVAQLFALSSRSSQSASSSSLPNLPSNLNLIPRTPNPPSSSDQHPFSSSSASSSNPDAQTQAQIDLINSVNRYYAALAAEVEARDKIRRFGKPLGGLFIGAAVVVMLIGVYRYFLTQHLLTKNQFSATRLPVFLLSALVGAIAVIVFGCLLAGYR